MAALANASLKASKPPSSALMASASLPAGSPPLPLPRIVQNSEWLACPPPLLRTAVRMFSGTLSNLAISDSIGWLPSVDAFDGLVQVGDVGGMMLVVMDFHRLGVDVRFESVERIRQWRKFVSH